MHKLLVVMAMLSVCGAIGQKTGNTQEGRVTRQKRSYGLTTTGFTVLGGVLLSVLTLATLPGNRRSGQQYDRWSGKQGTRRYGDQANRLDQGHVQYYPGFTGRV
eukprot:TRINITY_DN5766_c0_g1_i1.p1 TRINITY_DN5766_c0_g1~~TRINITY_DN5766_c0_g1_i1.p1  ORF type:complete len:104 (-),score=24.35 TRINITY_DN5766_c0_g1_i1:51-362(-)